MAVALFGCYCYAQDLPLTAGGAYPLTGVLVTSVSGNNQLALNNPAVNWGFISNPSMNIWSLGYGPSITSLGTPVLSWNTSGYIGIGTTSPTDLLQVNNGGAMRFQVAATKGIWVNNEVNGGTPTSPAELYLNYSSSGNTLINTNGGNVGIGTLDTKGYRLAVNGSAIATSMTVKLYANWPDYVFKPQYKLPSLSTVKAYIDKNQHLPEMPSEREVKSNGINLGEIVKVQTKKIEELTLYLIEKDKQLSDQQQNIKSQQAQIDELREQLKSITRFHPQIGQHR